VLRDLDEALVTRQTRGRLTETREPLWPLTFTLKLGTRALHSSHTHTHTHTCLAHRYFQFWL